MFKLCILSALLALASAQPVFYGNSYVGAPVVSSPFSYAPAPVAYSAPIVKTALPVATSYANTYKLAVRNPYVAAPYTYAASPYTAPAIAAPYAHPYAHPYGAPAIAASAYAAPLAHAPLAYSGALIH